MKHTFKKPYKFEGSDYEEIDLDFDSLDGEAIMQVNREFSAAGNFAAVPAADMTFNAYIAAKASKQPIEFIKKLPASEFMGVTVLAQNFLLGAV